MAEHSERQERQRVGLGDGWQRQTQAGTQVINMPLTPTAELVLFENDRRQKDTDPQWAAYLSSREPRPDGGRK